MTGAMYSSIAGLKAHMQKLTVIGNNVANVNTQGYKKQRTIFRDSMYGLYSGGSNGSATVGSMNPSQLGYGSLVASIDLDMSSSSYAPGNASDCALAGEGFFLVGNKALAQSIDPTNANSLKTLKLTRLGDFHFGADGYLVDGQGNVVYGFMSVDSVHTDKDGNTVHDVSDQLVPIRLPKAEWVETTTGTGDDAVTSTKYTVRYAQDKVPNEDGTYPAGGDYIELRDYQKPAAPGGGTDTTTPELELEDVNIESISIDAGTGAITGTVKGTNEVITIGYLAIGSVSNPNGVSHLDSSYYQCGDGAGDLRVSMLGGVQEELGISTVNKSLLTLWQAKNNDANAEVSPGCAIFSAGDTNLMVGFLETSNVDLATEISELITTQRGYQANTRIITVTDSMLEELVNMKR